MSGGNVTGHAELPRVFGDRYELIDVVGEGATAATWRALDRRLGRQVAIKILKRDTGQDAAWVRRFEREASTSASISHTNVVHVYDVGRQDGWLYLVMQFVDGEDLKALIRRRGRIPAAEAVGYIRQILEGVSAIHRAGILHRDIKPQNVLINGEGIARVADFGIAYATGDSGLTTDGVAVGTAAYMAPEQAQAGSLSEATDIYAVGAVLYEMLTGTIPYVRESAVATMLAHVQETPVPPSARTPSAGIPARLDAIVLQAMARDPADRFRNAAAMLRALDDPGSAAGKPTRIEPRRAQPSRTPEAPPSTRARPRVVTMSPTPDRHSPPSSGPGRGVLTIFLVLILIAMAAYGAYMVYDGMRAIDREEHNPAMLATATRMPEHHAEPTNIPVIDPSTLEPTSESISQEPTSDPTIVVIQPIGPESTDPPDQLIEPQS